LDRLVYSITTIGKHSLLARCGSFKRIPVSVRTATLPGSLYPCSDHIVSGAETELLGGWHGCEISWKFEKRGTKSVQTQEHQEQTQEHVEQKQTQEQTQEHVPRAT
jgi:hypothetical protein